MVKLIDKAIVTNGKGNEHLDVINIPLQISRQNEKKNSKINKYKINNNNNNNTNTKHEY